MSETANDKFWASFLREMKRQAARVDGFGEVTIIVKFHASAPRGMRVVKREETYRFDAEPAGAG